MQGRYSEINADVVYVEKPMENQNVNIGILVNVVFYLSCPSEESKDKLLFSYSLNQRIIFNKLKEIEGENIIFQKDCIIDCSDLYFDVDEQCVDYIGMHEKLWEVCADLQNYFNSLCFDSTSNVNVHIYVSAFKGLEEMALTFCNISDLSESHLVIDEYLESIICDCAYNDTFPFTSFIRELSWKISVEFFSVLDYELVIAVPKEAVNNPVKNNSVRVVPKKPKNVESDQNQNKVQPISQFSTSDNETKYSNSNNNEEILTFKLYVQESNFNYSQCTSFFGIKELIKYLPPHGIQYLLFKIVVKIVGADKAIKHVEEGLKCMIKGDWEDAKNHWKEGHFAAISAIHDTLTIVSFIPGFGTIAAAIDLLVFYPIEGLSYKLMNGKIRDDFWSDVGWCTLGLVPFGKICKYIPKGIKAIRAVKVTSEAVEISKKIENIKVEKEIAENTIKKASQVIEKTKNNVERLQARESKGKANSARVKAITNEENLRKALSELRNHPDYIRSIEKDAFNFADTLKNVMEEANSYYSIITQFCKEATLKEIELVSANVSAIAMEKGIKQFMTEYCHDLILKGLREGKISLKSIEVLGDFVYNLTLQTVNKNSFIRKLLWKDIIKDISKDVISDINMTQYVLKSAKGTYVEKLSPYQEPITNKDYEK